MTLPSMVDSGNGQRTYELTSVFVYSRDHHMSAKCRTIQEFTGLAHWHRIPKVNQGSGLRSTWRNMLPAVSKDLCGR